MLTLYELSVDSRCARGQGTQHDLLQVPRRRLRGAGDLCGSLKWQDSSKCRFQEEGGSGWLLKRLLKPSKKIMENSIIGNAKFHNAKKCSFCKC